MKFFPFRKHTYHSKLSTQELRKRLQEKLAEPKIFSYHTTSTDKLFEGVLNRSGFKMTQIIDYRNGFRPVISGVFRDEQSGVKIDVTMRLSKFTLIFMCFWLGIVGLVVLFMISVLILGLDNSSGNEFDPAALIPFCLFVLGYLLFTLPFNYEANRSKKILLELFDAE